MLKTIEVHRKKTCNGGEPCSSSTLIILWLFCLLVSQDGGLEAFNRRQSLKNSKRVHKTLLIFNSRRKMGIHLDYERHPRFWGKNDSKQSHHGVWLKPHMRERQRAPFCDSPFHWEPEKPRQTDCTVMSERLGDAVRERHQEMLQILSQAQDWKRYIILNWAHTNMLYNIYI